MIKQKDIEQRVDRLEELMVGMGKELALWRGKATPLLDVERREYLDRVTDVIKGADDARVALLQALERVQREARQARGVA